MNKVRERMEGIRAKMAPLCIGITALVALAVWAPSAVAFPNPAGTGQCVSCHSIFSGGSASAGHAAHLDLGLPQSCNTCHVNIGDTPDTTRCGECHVDLGLANHHLNSGASSSCVMCHTGTPAPENTPVPGYATITATLDPCDGSEELFASNTVSLDNDGDGLTDGDDPDCASPPAIEICTDGVDNDNDGDIDCADTDCTSDPTCQPETDCSDGIDNDGDGVTDCNDTDCDADPACMTPQQETDCGNGVDEDGDGLVDCADTLDCVDAPACQPEVEICTDGIDNDGDGLTDCNDPDCFGAANCQPPTMENCTDGVDNDGDLAIDCNDQDCAMAPACQQPIMEDCDDGIDNDNDGFVDCKDPNCSTDPVCATTGNDGATLYANNCADCHGPGNNSAKLCADADRINAAIAANIAGKQSLGLSDADVQSIADFLTSDSSCTDPQPPGAGLPADHTDREEGAFHKPGKDRPFSNGCTACHGDDLTGGIGTSCFACHGREWDERTPTTPPTPIPGGPPADHTDREEGAMHKPGQDRPFSNGCTACHGSDLNGDSGPSCFTCHGREWDESATGNSGDNDDRRRTTRRRSRSDSDD